MNCPTCHKEIPADSSSCPSCGLSFDDVTQRLESGSPAGKAPGKRAQSATAFDSIDNARFVPGAILVERYRIVGLLGKGGMGEVYRADDLKLSQPVALKFLPDHLLSDGAALARFHREVRVARQVAMAGLSAPSAGAAATISGEGVSPAARAAAIGSPPGSAAATCIADAGL